MAKPLLRDTGDAEPTRLDERAANNLLFIRDTMERAGSFTGISGLACVGMGGVALAGAYIASWRLGDDWWVWVWAGVATLGWTTGVAGMWLKARRTGTPLMAGAGKRFILGFSPPIVAGIIVTELFHRLGMDALMPGVWLLMYGVAILAGGAYSVRIVPLFGAFLMVLGHVVLLLPIPHEPLLISTMNVDDVILAAAFGGLHILFGLIVIRRYGG